MEEERIVNGFPGAKRWGSTVWVLGARAKLPVSWGGGQAWKCVSYISQEWSRVSTSVGGYVILQEMGPGGISQNRCASEGEQLTLKGTGLEIA